MQAVQPIQRFMFGRFHVGLTVNTRGHNMPNEADDLQNSRIRDLEKRVNHVENELSAILAELGAIKTLAKGLLMAVGLTLGIDVVPLMGGV